MRHLPLLVTLLLAHLASANPRDCFEIQILDDQSNRPVPLVELRTTNAIRYYTDSAGRVAFNEPGMMDKDIYFDVKSHGYEFPKDGLGSRGVTLKTTPGTRRELKIRRINIAQRLYRVTGQGIYADSVLLGHETPIKHPLLTGDVFGQDSVHSIVYNNKIFWLWGDTTQPRYPLGNFGSSVALSELPSNGGLKPSVGVDLTYYVDPKTGFSRAVIPVKDNKPVWMGAFMILKDEKGKDRLVGHYARVPGLAPAVEQGLAMWDDQRAMFDPIIQFPLDAPIVPGGRTLRVTDNGVDYVYFACPIPVVRVRADLKSVKDLKQYETYTALKPGTKWNKDNPPYERGQDGKLLYAWKKNTDRSNRLDSGDIIKGKTYPDDFFVTKDIETDKPVIIHGGSVYWNDYRKKYIHLFVQAMGTSFLGEVWLSESDRPEGPYHYAKKILTHDNYSFYNPTQHPFFDEAGGRVIYFDGTYVTTFTNNKDPTPRYEYNQVMYQLDLSDPRLKLK